MKRIIALALIFIMLGGLSIPSRAADITAISSATFKNNHDVTTIYIGKDVYDISETAFRGLRNLRDITVSESNPFYSSYDGCLYDKYMTELMCFPPALKGAVIPSTVISISTYALHGVPEQLKGQIIEAVESQALENGFENDAPGAHFIHTEDGVKWKKEDGSVISPDSNLMDLAANVVEASSNSFMTRAEQLEAAFDCLSKGVIYERSSEVPTGDWTKEYAAKTMSTNKGNCYGYAAAFAYIARGLGYEARVCTGTVTSSLGGRTGHAWTEVKIGKKWYVFDAEMQRAKGGGYYKQTYESYPAGPLEKESSQTVSF